MIAMKTLVIVNALLIPVGDATGSVERIEIPAARCEQAIKDETQSGPLFSDDPDSGWYFVRAAWCE